MESENALNAGNLDTDQTKSEETPTPPSMESLLQGEDLTLDFPSAGEIRSGVIVSISEDQILVGVGTKSEGIIPRKDLEQLSPEELKELDLGKEIPVYVVTPEDAQGNLLLSYSLAVEENDWKLAESLLRSGDVYEGEITGYNKGGLIVNVGRLRGFVPGSQISLSRRMAYGGSTPDQRWGRMIGEAIATRVIEVDRERRRLILSERAALQEARELLKERLLDELAVGQVHAGRITSLADFGAFVNIQGADGLVHLTEISWERINHPSEVLKVGQEVQVKVIDVDHERKRIGLSIRQLQDDPWPLKVADLQVGQLVEGQIVRLVKFGAFARIQGKDIEGLIHISELSDSRIEHPKEVIKEGETLTLRIVNIDVKRHRVGLSLRKVDSPRYADLDWELTLAEGIEGLAEAAEEELDAEAAAGLMETAAVEEIEAAAADEKAEIRAAAVQLETEAVEEIEAAAAEEIAGIEAEADLLEDLAVEEIEMAAAAEIDEIEEEAELLEAAAIEEIEAGTFEDKAGVEDAVVAQIEAEADREIAAVEADAMLLETMVVEEIEAEAEAEASDVETAAEMLEEAVVQEIEAEAAVEEAEVEIAAGMLEEIVVEEAEAEAAAEAEVTEGDEEGDSLE
jgi:small subunit ribosomal protein S1